MPSVYVEVAVNVPQVMDVYHYHLPPELHEQVQAGHLVEVPFGQQMVQGVVLREVPEPSVPTTRPVTALVDAQPVLTAAQITLAQVMSAATLAPLAACIELMLPPGLAQQADTVYTLCDPLREVDSHRLGKVEGMLVALLQKRGSLRGRQIDHFLSKTDWRKPAQHLIKKGLLRGQPVLPAPSLRPKLVRTARLACPPEVAEEAMPRLARAGSPALRRRQVMLGFFLREPDSVDVTWAYAESGGNWADLQALEALGLVILGETEVLRDPLAQVEVQPNQPPILTAEQETAWQAALQSLRLSFEGRQAAPSLLHGVTGSGKTEIYLRLVAEALRLERQAIVLVPEIALTPQAIHRFVGRFPGQVGVVHSQLSIDERYDTWRRVRAGQLPIVIGPRSALFSPLPRLGLIVVDECHDDSYYQSEGVHYHAVEAARAYARLIGGLCLLGSATPGLEMRFRAERERWQVISLPNRLLAHKQVVEAQARRLGIESRYQLLSNEAETADLPPVQVVDMRQELKAGNLSIFSRALLAELGRVLEQRQQAILFLNRRGTATYVFCRDCGYTLKCPRCDIPLTYHTYPPIGIETEEKQRSPALVCHHCNYRRKMPARCPECEGTRIRQYGTGTEAVEKEVERLFPQAHTLRWDAESTRQKGAHEIILSHFANGRADVLVGTQMIAKGLDLPLVTLVGVVLADVGLSLPDYRARERTFQILTQVAGRAGRSPLGGSVVLQTFQPENDVILAAARHDYQAFYTKELDYRRQLGYPPFSRFVRLEYQDRNELRASRVAARMAAQLQAWIAAGDRRATELIGPAPCFFQRIAGLYRWQIILRGPDPASLLRGRDLVDWSVEVDPVSLL